MLNVQRIIFQTHVSQPAAEVAYLDKLISSINRAYDDIEYEREKNCGSFDF